ncbi:MAG: hypothetical protein AB7I18_01425 [Candidatus Berkiella sp.]
MLIEIVITAAVALAGLAGYVAIRRRQRALVPVLSLEDTNLLPLLRLEPKVTWCKYLENIGVFGKRASEQFARTREVAKLSFTVLKQKFKVDELTYARYEKTLIETNAVLTDNLSKMIPLLEALDQVAEEEALEKQKLAERIENLLSSNQSLLDKLNELITNLSDIKNLSGPDKQTTDFLVDNLKTMTDRAKLY